MSEIEMANLRSTNPTPEYDVPYGHENNVASAQDHLLTGNHVRNGNGSPGFYNQYKQNVYEIGMHRPQPPGHGSGMVFRRRRRPCWCVLLVIVAVAFLAAGISLGVLFGVVRKAELADSEHSGQDGDGSRNSSDGTVMVLKNNSVTTQSSRTQAPSRTPTPSPETETSGKIFNSGTGSGVRWGVSVRRFKAFWHPGDSRILEVLLSNGTRLLAAGHKGNDGTLKGLYSLSLIDGQRRTTRVRFMGPHNLASIILPDGTIVNLDWSSNNQDVECKVFQIPPPVTSLASAARELNRPTSHLATLQLGVHSYLLRQVSRIINEAGTNPGGIVDDEPISPSSQKLCTPRLPVKVTKCGGQYPYDGAFVQGDVTLQNGATLPMAALPWLRDDDDDDCYRGVRESAPNFYIPLPGYIEQTTAREIVGRYLHSAARWWGRVCEVVGSVLEVDIERHEVCANMAVSAQTQLSHNILYRVVYDSCTALLSSLYTACKALDEVSQWAATDGMNGDGGRDSNRASSGTGSATGDASRQRPAQSILERALGNATSLQEPATSRQQQVDIKTYAFCPSTQPLTSYEKPVLLQTPSGGGNITVSDMMHVNCMGHPEVTYFYLGHAAAEDSVKHRLQVCAVCAYEKTISVHVQHDQMCCNDTCTKEAKCEETPGDTEERLRESHTFREQNSVYCHEFLTAAESPLPELPRDCRGTCQSSLQVRFQVKDAETMDAGARVYMDQVLACHEGYRPTCKSTFGH